MKSRRPALIHIEWHDIWLLLAALCVMASAIVVAKVFVSYWSVMVAFGMFCIILSYGYWIYWRDR